MAALPRHLHGLGGQIEKPLRRAIVLVALLALIVAGLLWVRHHAALTSTERKLVGSWVMADSPATTKVFNFAPDRAVTARIVDHSGAMVGEVLGDKNEIWLVDGQTVFIRRGRKGSPSLLERISGNDRLWDRWPIASLTDDTLVIGDESWGKRFVLTRRPAGPHRSE
jgi:hypothetical protein